MAVLEKRAGLLLQTQDAYFKSTGGLKLNEPAVDLAIAMSIVQATRKNANGWLLYQKWLDWWKFVKWIIMTVFASWKARI